MLIASNKFRAKNTLLDSARCMPSFHKSVAVIWLSSINSDLFEIFYVFIDFGCLCKCSSAGRYG